jgi:hypothetical protein
MTDGATAVFRGMARRPKNSLPPAQEIMASSPPFFRHEDGGINRTMGPGQDGAGLFSLPRPLPLFAKNRGNGGFRQKNNNLHHNDLCRDMAGCGKRKNRRREGYPGVLAKFLANTRGGSAPCFTGFLPSLARAAPHANG